MPNYSFQTARRIISGAGSLQSLKEYIHELGPLRRVLIFTQPSVERLGYVALLTKQLDELNISWEVNKEIKPEPTAEQLTEIFSDIQSDIPDALIGFGGGSVLDAVKLLSVLFTNPMPVTEMLGVDKIPNRGIPMMLIPTTSGTGSEVTPNAIVTLPKEELKIGAVSKWLLPHLAVLDPLVTLELPKAITASTGMDAFTHSLESYISNKANPLSDAFALQSIRLISGSITSAYHEGGSVRARGDMLMGSMLGGMALTGAGTAAVHAMAYPLGGKYHIPHGVANSMLLPHVMNYIMDAIEERLMEVGIAMGLGSAGDSRSEVAERVVQQIEAWTKELQIPQNLSEFGVTDSDISALAAAASQVTRLMSNNRKELSIPDLERIYRKLLP
ncbi:iron-containing alcohol dehydrogenase [Paenibacillus sp. NPDC056579]|uniref:iron-containing alcohol dehydrogenase n=1 Tax=Paenibacillus sp. NPDC056579 TaxID=3345871 RepID=UPI00369E3F0F